MILMIKNKYVGKFETNTQANSSNKIIVGIGDFLSTENFSSFFSGAPKGAAKMYQRAVHVPENLIKNCQIIVDLFNCNFFYSSKVNHLQLIFFVQRRVGISLCAKLLVTLSHNINFQNKSWSLFVSPSKLIGQTNGINQLSLVRPYVIVLTKQQ